MSHSTEHGADTGDQFTRAEWFRDVIVAAQFEALDAVRFRSLRSQKNDRSPRECRSLPNMPAQFESVSPRKHHVQQKKRGHFAHGLAQHRSPAHEALHVKPGSLKVMSDQPCNVFFILNDKDEGPNLP